MPSGCRELFTEYYLSTTLLISIIKFIDALIKGTLMPDIKLIGLVPSQKP